jgi:hypothetical protein
MVAIDGNKNSAAVGSGGQGIFMPQPKVFTPDTVKEGQVITVAQNEPIYFFMPAGIDVYSQLKHINKRGPFDLKQLDKAPDRAPNADARGTWFELSVKPGKLKGVAKAELVTTMAPGRQLGDKHFELKVGPNIYYMMGPRG